MMRACHTALCLTAAMLAALLLGGCEGRELCYDHSHKLPVSIRFDWTDVPEAQPETMVVWFFPVDGSPGLRFELTGDGNTSRTSFDAEVRVPAGTYRMVCHNGSTEFNVERGSNIDDYFVVTYDVPVLSSMNRTDDAPLPGDDTEMPVRSQASTFYAHTLDSDFTVAADGKTQHTVLFRPSRASVLCEVSVTNVHNLTSDITLSAVLTGASEGWHAGTAAPAETCVAVPFPLQQSGPDSLHGTVELFGLSGVHKLRIYTSNKYYYDYNVTDQIDGQKGLHYIHVDVSGIKLPDSPSSGLSPGVSDWGDMIEESVKM